MRAIGTMSVGLVLLAGLSLISDPSALADERNTARNIAILDDCLRGDAGFPGGCTKNGDVSAAEFGALLTSPLTDPPFNFLIGHPSWRIEPSHSVAEDGNTIRVRNKGGRPHTFTEVNDFGGGFVDDLNIGLNSAPECGSGAPAQGVEVLNPGASDRITGLTLGLHKFQCCIHPWMRATIRIVEEEDDDDND